MKKKEGPAEETSLEFDKMTDKQMDNLLYELKDTSFWQAILKFNRQKYSGVTGLILSVDVFKEPTQAARAQGQGVGMFLLETHVGRLVQERNSPKYPNK